jgi:hypothetical protein
MFVSNHCVGDHSNTYIHKHTYIHTHNTNIHTCYFIGSYNIPIQYHKGKGKGKIVPVHTMKVHNGRRGTTPHIRTLRARWRWAVNITLQLLYAWEGTPVPVAVKAGWTPELVPSSAKIQTTDCPVCILVTTGTLLSNITVISNLYSSQTFKKCTGMTLTSGNTTVSCPGSMFILEYSDMNKLIAENGELTLSSCK